MYIVSIRSMHLPGAAEVFLAVILSLSSAANLPGSYLAPRLVGPTPTELVLPQELVLPTVQYLEVNTV